MADRILRGGRVIDPKNGLDGVADVVIENGRIAAVTPNYAGHAAEETDCTGLVVCPGLVDSHLHLGSVFGSPYGMRMAALSGVTTCLDMAGPLTDVLHYAPETGCGIHAAVLEGFDPKARFGTDKPTRDELGVFVEESLAAGAVGVKIMGGHWPLPLETSSELIRVANERDAYVAWHAGSTTAGSNLLGMRETIEAAGTEKLHLAHINAYCRGRVKAVEEETAEAIELLKSHPNIWCESYVSPMNGTILTCDAEGVVIDHVTRNCLATFGRTPDKAGMIEAFRHGEVQAIVERGGVSVLVGGEEGLDLWLKAETATAGSFPVNPATSRFLLAQAKRGDGSFVVDAIGTDGGCIPRNVLLSVGLSLVKFGALTLTEFVQKTSLNPARHLRLADRGHLSEGAAADVTVFDFERQKAFETIADGKTVMKDGKLVGKGVTFITTERGRAALEKQGFATLTVDFSGPEPERLPAL